MRKILTSIVLVVLLSAQAPADQITLKNGDRLTGKIVKSDGWQVIVSDRFLSDPPPGLEKNDLLLTTGLKIKLGKIK